MSASLSLHDPLEAHQHQPNEYVVGADNNAYTQQLTSEDVVAVRRRALAEIDNAKFGWFHIKACL
ncbi:hypothetical protein GGI24_006696, partial [Coemansia furcata]